MKQITVVNNLKMLLYKVNMRESEKDKTILKQKYFFEYVMMKKELVGTYISNKLPGSQRRQLKNF